MEDLWHLQNSGIDLDEFADMVEYNRFLDRFNENERETHKRKLLYGETSDK